MKLTLNWIKRHIDFVDLTIEDLLYKIEEAVIKVGMELDEVQFINPLLQVQIKKVINIEGLRVKKCLVNLSSFKYIDNKEEILCGGTNVQEGMYSLLAPLGTTLKNGMTILERKIRGHSSYGMLLSSYEAGISEIDDGSGKILNLNAESKLYSYDDIILDFKPSFNRWDLHNARGIARVLSMAGLGKFKALNLCHSEGVSWNIPIHNSTNVVFTFGRVDGISVRDEVIHLMKIVGKNSRNQLQILNDFVVMDIGHPIAIYDIKYTKEIFIKQKQDNSIVISNDTELICIGGVQNVLGYDEYTQNVVIEAAYFLKKHIKSLKTNSAYMFWLGVDETQMVLAYVYGLINGEKYKIYYGNGLMPASNTIMVNCGDIYKYSNLSISAEKAIKMLESVGFVCELCMQEDVDNRINGLVSIKCICPPWRKDITLSVHIIEDLVRLYGYNEFLNTNIEPVKHISNCINFVDEIKIKMITYGYTEIRSLPFVASGDIEILNAISKDKPFLRSDLFNSLFAHTTGNSWQHKYFTYDKVFKNEGECDKLGILLKGCSNRDWRYKSQDFTFFDLKEVVENLGISLTPDYKNSNLPSFCSYGLVYKEGYIGKITNHVAENTYYAEFTINPSPNRLTIFNDTVSYYDVNVSGDFIEILEKYANENFYVFDIYENDGVTKYGLTFLKN